MAPTRTSTPWHSSISAKKNTRSVSRTRCGSSSKSSRTTSPRWRERQARSSARPPSTYRRARRPASPELEVDIHASGQRLIDEVARERGGLQVDLRLRIEQYFLVGQVV